VDSICIYPPQSGLGGPASFSGRLAEALARRGVEVQSDPLASGCAAVLVIGGSKHLDLLWQTKRRGVRIVQRLNGMNWLHRRVNTGVRHYLRSEVNNWILATIRRGLAGRIVYQSQFSQDWWDRVYGPVNAAGKVVYNGVNLQAHSPQGAEERPSDAYRLLLVEGHLAGGHATGLHNAVALLAELGKNSDRSWELVVAGDVPAGIRASVEAGHPGLRITWAGVVSRQQIPVLDRSAHVLFSGDLNAACPNAVIEALACGLPVAAYATGALPEMVSGDAGCVVPYGGDVWKLAPPDVAPLAAAVEQIALQQEKYRPGARARAEAQFDIEKVVDQYLEALF
jgi:glycosyltransferase involved in cell wall biosynthesis